jgi:hypothetical protein
MTSASSNTTIGGTIVAASSEYCLCPVCYRGDNDARYSSRPPNGQCNVNDGWFYAVTTTRTRVVHSLPKSLRVPPIANGSMVWSSIDGCTVTNTDKSTSSVSYMAELETSTRHINGGEILISHFEWKCLGLLCKDSCGSLVELATDALTCIVSLFTKCKICKDQFGFPLPPPPPPFPPVLPASLSSLLNPTTSCSAAPYTTGTPPPGAPSAR